MINEWLHEPNEVTFEHAGFKCYIIRHPHAKHLCGYVGLPKGHPYYRIDYDKINNIEVHGGLTYSNFGVAGKAGINLWYIGFDCAHSNDFCPGYESITGYSSIKEVGDAKYRNIKYVVNETKKLAEQVTVLNLAIRKFKE